MGVCVFKRIEKLFFKCLRIVLSNVGNYGWIIVAEMKIYFFVLNVNTIFTRSCKSIGHTLIIRSENHAVISFEIQRQFIIYIGNFLFLV